MKKHGKFIVLLLIMIISLTGCGNNGVTQTEGEATITMEEAGTLALEKVPGATDTNMRIKEDREDGRLVYEGSILYENKEYDFQIDAATGEFIEWEID